jgi:hypothetical protein
MRGCLLLPNSGWDDGSADMRTALDAVETKVRTDAIAECERICQDDMEAAVDGPGWLVITELPTDLWARLRAIVKQALKQNVTTVSARLKGFGCEHYA